MLTEKAPRAISYPNVRLKIFLHVLLFVAGFSLVFIVGWGGSASLLGQVFGTYKRTIAQIGGIVVILFGLATLDVIRLPWFYADTRAQYSGRRGTLGSSALMSVFFAAGWIKHMRPYQKYFRITSGVFIITIGVLLLTNMMSLIAIWAFKHGYYIESFATYAAAPTYLSGHTIRKL
jgi:cytochrome c-type biogenesis protein